MSSRDTGTDGRPFDGGNSGSVHLDAVLDGHVRIGRQREAELDTTELLTRMDRLGIARALVAPSEAQIAVHNTAGNDATTTAARDSGGRLLAYAVANPWFGRAAVDELRRAHDLGAVALSIDSALQGFDLLDGQIEPLLAVATKFGWPVLVRTGTPPTHLPLTVALLARRHPELSFLMGRSGATDFWIDAVPAMLDAPNLYADTCYAAWDTTLTHLLAAVGPERLVFCSDQPYTAVDAEVAGLRRWPLPAAQRAMIMGGNLTGLLPAEATRSR